jgi:hypothetical protein
MNCDYARRGCSLPEGCKDLIDVSKYLVHEGNKVLIDLPDRKVQKHAPKRLRPAAKLIGELRIQEQISVREFAALLGQHPSRIIVDLLRIGIYSSVDTRLEFGAVRRIAREYGYEVKRLA